MEAQFDLERFVQAQEPVYAAAVAELRAGRKRTHWMWFVFPQIAGLGTSQMAQRYALASGDEAAAYLAHPLLGRRLRECAAIVASLDTGSAEAVFGHPDDLKFRSSMTLFADVAPLLGRRLRECAAIVASLDTGSAEAVFGHPDDLKFRSSMTLFADVAPDEAVFQACIDKFYDGEPDPETLARL